MFAGETFLFIYFFKSGVQKSLCENFLTQRLQNIVRATHGNCSGTEFDVPVLQVDSWRSEPAVQRFPDILEVGNGERGKRERFQQRL